MIRIGLSGTNWTGKSTVISGLLAARPRLRFDVVSLSPLVSECPHPTIQRQTIDASIWMLDRVRRVLDRPIGGDVQVFDRSPIDILAFTRYAFLLAEREADEELMTSIAGLASEFERIYFLSPSSKWPVGPPRDQADIAFALLMDYHMERVACDYAIEVHRLPWDLEERVGGISAALG